MATGFDEGHSSKHILLRCFFGNLGATAGGNSILGVLTQLTRETDQVPKSLIYRPGAAWLILSAARLQPRPYGTAGSDAGFGDTLTLPMV